MQWRRGAGYGLAVAPGLVVCGSSCRRIGVPARSSVAFLRYPRDGCAISVLVRVGGRKGLGLVQHLLLVYGFIRIRVTGVRVVLRTRTSCASTLVVTCSRSWAHTRHIRSGCACGRSSRLRAARSVSATTISTQRSAALRAHRARAFGRCTEQPSRRDRVRPGAGSPCTRRASDLGSGCAQRYWWGGFNSEITVNGR